MTTKLSAIRRTGQEPAICRHPPIPPTIEFPWQPLRLYASIILTANTPPPPLARLGVYLELTRIAFPASYRATWDDNTQRVQIDVHILSDPDIAHITIRYYPTAPRPGVDHEATITIPTRNPLHIKFDWPSQYPDFSSCDLILHA
jgi:hypothetical protein